MNFPIYRKYSNNKSYFKVLAHDHFEEVQVIGNHYSVHLFTAKILPDRNLISDMITLEGNSWEAITAEEYEAFVNECRMHRTKTGDFH